MSYWLVKSEPSCWSFADHLAKGVEPWDGVRNHQANGNMKAMALGDLAFFYHSQKERACVGLLEVSVLWRPDPSDESGRFGMVDFRALRPLPHPVTLAQIKADPRLANLALLKQSRLSVVPIEAEAWQIMMEMAQ
jgi:predicted RNA-binding protein with PUA-like domain